MLRTRKMGLALGATLALGLALARPAPAQVTFMLGNNPQPDEENVLLNTGLTGTTIFGTTNQTGIGVSFTSTEVLTAPANGQARVEGVDGLVGGEPLTISLVGGATFADIIFNPFFAPNGGDLAVTANTTAGSASFTYGIGNGQNFLTIVANAGVRINSVVLDPTIGFTDLRQVRISGARRGGGGGGGEVPEPGALAMLAGMGLGGVAVLRRVRR